MLERTDDIPSPAPVPARSKPNTHSPPGKFGVGSMPSEDFTPNMAAARAGRFGLSKKLLFVLPLLLAVAVGGFMLARPHAPATEPAAAGTRAPVVTVTVDAVSMRPLARQLTVNGSISAWDPLSLGTQANGLRIETVNVEEGDVVGRGQVLATLDSSVLRAQLRQAQATLKASQATYRKALQPNRAEDIDALRAAQAQAKAAIAQEEANLVRASANLANAKLNAARYEDLLKQGAVSQQETETRATSLEVAEAELRNAGQKIAAARFVHEQAKQRLLMAQRGGRAEDIEYSAAGMEQQRAEVSRLQAQVEQTIIRAPDDGIIIKRDAHIGDIAMSTKPLFTMVRDSRLELRAQIPEVDLPLIKPGQPVALTSSGTGRTTMGRVREISPQVDPGSRLGTARIDVPNDAGFLPGMFVNATVNLGEQPTLAVPSKAVVSKNDHSFVFVLNGDAAVQKPVTLGARRGDFIEITSGLEAGDKLIVSGAGFLKDGDPVRVAPALVPGSEG